MAEGNEQQAGAPLLCGVCTREIDEDVAYIEASCNNCGRHRFHTDCVTPLMQRIHHDSTRAMERARRMVATRPAHYMAEQKMHCPIALTNARVNCGGRIVDADMVKPARAPLPPPPGLPAPAPRSKKKRKGGGRIGVPAATPPAGRRAGAVSAPEGLTRKQQREQRRAAAERSTSSAAPGRGRDSAAWGNEHGDGSGAGATARAGGTQPRSARLKFPPGHRPVELQRCQDYDELGECYIHRCPRCHGDEELQQREREWVAQQEAKQREKRQEELARHEAVVAARVEQTEWWQRGSASGWGTRSPTCRWGTRRCGS